MAVEVPTPTGPARPDLTILETADLPGPQHLVLPAGHPPRRRPRQPRGLPDRLPAGLHRPAARAGAGAAATHLLPRAPRRLRRAAPRGHLARARRRARRAPAADARRPRRRGAARPARSRASRGRYNVVYSYTDETVGVAAGKLAVRLLNHLVEPEDGFDFETEFNAFLRQAERVAFGPSTAAILEEAASRDIPFIRLNSASLVQLGQGVHAQRIRATMTSKTGALAVDIASDKDLTTKLLGSAGLPVPKQEAVAHAARHGGGGPPHRLPRRGQAARRQPRTRCLPGPAERRGGREGLRHRQGGVAARHDHRRVVRDRPRLPLPHRRRPDAGDRRAGAGPRRRRRHAHRRRARRDHQRRPPARRRSREGADQDQGRRQRARGSSPARATPSSRSRPRARWSSSP